MAKNRRIKLMVNWLISQGIINTQQELGEICGIHNKSRLSQLVNGHSYSREFINKFSEIDDRINVDWLLTGEGEMLKDSSPNIGEVSGNDNTIGMSVTQTIENNNGQNAGRDINNYGEQQLMAELKAQRLLAARQLEVYAASLDNKDEQIRTAHSQIETLIKQNQEQFNRLMSLLEMSRKN
ncbi:hypothetical protein [Bacteroides acidifaciens]|uniref:hypothetical protein n=1 Tax=Bacteroides acidifaciens TaxID=85831 RepID=UPI002639F671|nr:hypothetical protein [Bacteroides acidifaciens]